ncbi:MAG: hypothetical protein IKV16_03815 [Clostridia bacterium]|nr:hypothetical protein [Clostridia bacterium]
MSSSLKIGYFAHWFQPPYKFVDFLLEEGIVAEKIDFSLPGYLEGFDVVIIEQNGFNDYIENDELYIADWVKRGGILLFMHQDYMRWAPYFLPGELGYMPLVHRYVDTIGGCVADPTFWTDKTTYKSYMMPWIEENGRRLFSEPELITPDDMIMWKLDVNTFSILRPNRVKLDMTTDTVGSDRVSTAALSCFFPNPNFEVIGSFMDPGVKNGALILKGKYGKGMYFLNQILFPEIKNEEADRCFAFWRKYIKNLLAYFERYKNGESEILPIKEKKLKQKKNYKLAIHMHSLDWYGCDSAPGTINALMRYMNYDICSLAVKDNAPYDGNLDVAKYSDDKVLFLDGQEYHPFNWKDSHEDKSHGLYHALAIGIDSDAYTQKYTCSRFSDEEIDNYLREAVDYAHEKGGAICATHPYVPYWRKYPFDAVDKEPMTPLSGSDIEQAWLDGEKIALMNSVDLFGVRRMLDNPAVNFIYLCGKEPSRESVVEAIKAGHTIAAAAFDEADITIGDKLPGDTLTLAEAKASTLKIYAKVMRENIKHLRVYSGEKVVYSLSDINTPEISIAIPLSDFDLEKFIRVEIEGLNEHWICNSTPFYLN